jgi:allophanate hydrolase subunit 2
LTFIGPKLKFNSPAIISVSAYKAKVFLNGKPEKPNHQVLIKSGDILEVKNIQSRAYIAISGGLNTELSLGSRSQYQFITESFKLKKGDTISLKTQKLDFNKQYAAIRFDLSLYEQNTINVYTMPEYKQLDLKQKDYLVQNTFTISNQSNRMAYQLNEKLDNSLKGIMSKPVMPGTVQLTPEGKLVILMRDAQVTGGYPRLFQVSVESLNVLAQKSPNQSIKFSVKKPI